MTSPSNPLPLDAAARDELAPRGLDLDSETSEVPRFWRCMCCRFATAVEREIHVHLDETGHGFVSDNHYAALLASVRGAEAETKKLRRELKRVALSRAAAARSAVTPKCGARRTPLDHYPADEAAFCDLPAGHAGEHIQHLPWRESWPVDTPDTYPALRQFATAPRAGHIVNAYMTIGEQSELRALLTAYDALAALRKAAGEAFDAIDIQGASEESARSARNILGPALTAYDRAARAHPPIQETDADA